MQVAGVDELDAGDPVEVAETNALRKAQAVYGFRPPVVASADLRTTSLVLGVDTVVAVDDRIYGKPADAGQAHAMLQDLQGRTHTVVSGLALVRDGVPTVLHASTEVTFRALEPGVLRWYVGTGEWEGRAGGYAIQGRGAALVSSITGDYLNVVGLPVAALLDAAPDLLRAAR